MAHLSPRGIEIPLVISKQNRLTIMGRSLSYKGSIINLESIWKLNEIGGVLKACHEQFGKWIQFEKVQFSKNVACPASLLRLTFLNAWNNVCISDCKKRSLQFKMVLQIMHFYYFNSKRQIFFSKFNPFKFKCYTILFWRK